MAPPFQSSLVGLDGLSAALGLGSEGGFDVINLEAKEVCVVSHSTMQVDRYK